jgi:enoyl-CoA hydratase/carnithine racemase
VGAHWKTGKLLRALEQASQYEREMQTICMGTRDAAEGRSAFAEKRAPTFTGH